MYKNELENETWITNEIICLDSKVEEYVLIKFTKRKFAGNLIYFKENNIFESKYVSWCGNDNFTTVHGKYEFIDKDKIIFLVDSVSYSGEWKRPTEYRKILFKISKDNEKFILRLIKD